MADVINLNKARKAKARTEDKRQAAENRVVFGRTKAEKKEAAANKKLSDKRLDECEIE